MTSFVWRPGDPPPNIEEHSLAKLDVLRSYLHEYFDRLGSHWAQDVFRLDLVDGFSGGGLFMDGSRKVPGTPLIMLEEFAKARDRLNLRRTKPMNFDFKFHFVDVDRFHTDYLRSVLASRGYAVDGQEVVIHTSPFEEIADDIIDDIHRRQPRAGRAIFLLDQKGFSQVDLSLVARIFNRLDSAEVILTFAAESLINHLSDNPRLFKAVESLGITPEQILEMIELKDGDGGRAAVQRLLRDQVRSATGATFDTPFFIRPRHSRRALWFIHLSRHPTARDVMIQCHWNSFNTFEHYGPGDLDMLGWDALTTGTIPMFNFSELDAEQMRKQLLGSLLPELQKFTISEGHVSIDSIRHRLANRTAARYSDLDAVILYLARLGELEVLNKDGRPRSKSLTRLTSSDLVTAPRKPMFPGWFRYFS